MPQDERSLFGDEQAYIASKLHLAELERERKRKEMLAVGRRRRPHYTPGQRRIMRRFWRFRTHQRLKNDPIKLAKYRTYHASWMREWRRRNPEDAKSRDKRYYLHHRDDILMQKRVYHLDNREFRNDYNRAYYKHHRDELLAKRRVYVDQNIEQIRANNREYNANHREERRAYARMHQRLIMQDAEKRQRLYDQDRESRLRRLEDPKYRERLNAKRRAYRAAKKAAQ